MNTNIEKALTGKITRIAVEYHGCDWMLLVEHGWVTMTVDEHNIATLVTPYRVRLP